MMSGAFPIPANNGAKRRILATADNLSLSNDLTLVSFREDWENKEIPEKNEAPLPWRNILVDFAQEPKWRTAIRAVATHYSYGMIKYYTKDFSKIIAHLMKENDYDVIWFHTFNMLPYFRQCLTYYSQFSSHPIFVLDQHNVDELYFGSFLKSENKFVSIYAKIEVFKARYLERYWYPKFDVILSVSPEDVAITSRYVNENTRVCLSPNGVDTKYFKPVTLGLVKDKTAPVLVFGASLDVLMNQDAVHWFVDNVWPVLRSEIPDIQFWIVGRNPPENIARLNSINGITVTGIVPDVRVYYEKADVFVVPLRFGGGTKLKTIEALAMGLPVVSTQVGAQGLNVVNGKHLLISDNASEFASHVIYLIKNHDKAQQMGRDGRQLVEELYGWEGILRTSEDLIKAIYEQ